MKQYRTGVFDNQSAIGAYADADRQGIFQPQYMVSGLGRTGVFGNRALGDALAPTMGVVLVVGLAVFAYSFMSDKQKGKWGF